jgi:pimeloyl-ACP methyl ester carboxylesterase
MTPLSFGLGGRRLYGAYHPAASGGRGVVLVPPVGQEGVRSHRALRIWADALAVAGWHVLRFDPYGTGDSLGDSQDVTLGGMADDALTAATELTALSGARQLVLGGLRLGATAALLAARNNPVVRGLMLWEPVLFGGAWLREVDLPAGGANSLESQGFEYGATFRQEVSLLDPARVIPDGASFPKRAIVAFSGVASGDSSPERDAITARLKARIERLDVHAQLAPSPWTEENDFGAGPVPAATIAALAGWRG